MSHTGLNLLYEDTKAFDFIVSQRWERSFGNTTLHRGELYYIDEFVSPLTVTANASQIRIEASVLGTRSKPYTTRVNLLKNHRGFDLFTVCSCPVGNLCKHAAAILYSTEFELDTYDESTTSPLSTIDSWLSTLAETTREKKPKAPKTQARQTHALAYILNTELPQKLSLHLGKIRYSKNGDILLENADLTPNLKRKQPAYFQDGDYENAFAVLFKLPEDYHSYERVVTPEHDDLLFTLLETGRLFLDSQLSWNHPLTPLTPGPDLSISPSWKATPKGLYQPTLGENTDGLLLYSLSDHVYVDPDKGLLGRAKTPDHLSAPLITLWQEGPTVQAEEAAELCEKMESLGIPVSIPRPVTLPEEHLPHTSPKPVLILSRKPALSHLQVETFGGSIRQALPPQIVGELYFEYFEHRISFSEEKNRIRIPTPELIRILSRDLSAEAELLSQLSDCSLFPLRDNRSSREISPGHGHLITPNLPVDEWDTFWIQFLSLDLPELQDAGWNIIVEESAELNVIESEDIFTELQEDEERGIDWFRFESGVVDSDGQHISLLNLIAEFLKSSKDIPPDEDIGDDERIILPDPVRKTYFNLPAKRFFHIVRSVESLFSTSSDGLHRLEAASLAEELQMDESGTMADLRALGQQLKARTPHQLAPIPQGVTATLRDYQKDGFQWLQFLARHHLHGILADDMGLGKTLQTLSHIVAELEARRTDGSPSLVVAPTSVVPNWAAEAEKFCPDLKVLVLHGTERKTFFSQIPEHDLVITSYALLHRDEEIHVSQNYHLAILDEAHYIKNPKAKVAITASKLSARHRVCLSGTPMENHLGELWSLSRFLMPGLLGSEGAFKKIYKNPIERHQDSDAQTSLNARISPLILRRTKSQVIQELPEKTEIIHRITLTKAQQDLYESVRTAMDKKVRAAIEDRGLARSQILVLDALLKLRQICCHPQLLKTDIAQKIEHSAKLDFLAELLDTLVEEGRRILLFSQFTTMLQMIEKHLTAQNLPFVKLTGRTRDRKTPVETFQSGQVPIFLISLKAGGTGLNLTAADTVIHYDPWWNPAAENQATDRAHRIGQKNPVFVHKLICDGSIEERILQLQSKKSKLVEALLSKETSKLNLDNKTLESLLSPLG